MEQECIPIGCVPSAAVWGVSAAGLPRGRGSARGCLPRGRGCLPRAVCLPRMTDACENITFLQLLLRAVIMDITWKAYVLLRLRVQNRRKKWNFPLNFRTVAYPGLLLKGPSFRVTE